MTIFDGVDISPTTPSTLQRVIPFGLLVLRTLYEAGKNRDRRLEAQAQGRELTSVREMMELAGVKLPDIRAAVAELLGGSAELAQAATLIAENPDFASMFGGAQLDTFIEECASSGEQERSEDPVRFDRMYDCMMAAQTSAEFERCDDSP